jgi:hypothetical protein
MKQIIILCATMLLGVVIFNLVAGSQQDSVMNTVKSVWEKEIDMQKKYP